MGGGWGAELPGAGNSRSKGGGSGKRVREKELEACGSWKHTWGPSSLSFVLGKTELDMVCEERCEQKTLLEEAKGLI